MTIATLFASDPLMNLLAQVNPPAATISTPLAIKLEPHDPAFGSLAPALPLIAFNDYQCAYCLVFQQETFPKLKAEYLDTGKVRFVHKDLPLDFHTEAMPAARVARCAGEAGQFWAMHTALFAQAHCLACQGASGHCQDQRFAHACFSSVYGLDPV